MKQRCKGKQRYQIHFQRRKMPMAEERKVRQPASLWLISPPTCFSELLLQEVRISMQYLMAFSMFSFNLFLSPVPAYGFILRKRYIQTKNQMMHSAKQKLLSVFSRRQMRAAMFSVPLWRVLSQKPARSTRSPLSCIILKSFMPTPSSFRTSSMAVSYFDSHLITLRARMISLQRPLNREAGSQALRVLITAETRRRYLSILMVCRKWVLSVSSTVVQRCCGGAGGVWGCANGGGSIAGEEGCGCSPSRNSVTSSMHLRLCLSEWSGGLLLHSVSRDSLLICHFWLPEKCQKFQKFSEPALFGELGWGLRLIPSIERPGLAVEPFVFFINSSVILQGLQNQFI